MFAFDATIGVIGTTARKANLCKIDMIVSVAGLRFDSVEMFVDTSYGSEKFGYLQA
jgi:hypothetical protein